LAIPEQHRVQALRIRKSIPTIWHPFDITNEILVVEKPVRAVGRFAWVSSPGNDFARVFDKKCRRLSRRHSLDQHRPAIHRDDSHRRSGDATHGRAFSCQLLRRHVRRRPRRIPRRLVFLCRGDRETEIRDPHAAVAVDHDVRDVERLLVRQVADSLQQRREIFPVDELHRQKMLAVHIGDVVDATDVRMRELPCDPDFGEKPLTPNGVRRQRGWQKLQRDGLTKFQIVGAIHLAHPAAAEQPDDAIPGREHRARCQAADGNGVRRDQPAHARPRRRPHRPIAVVACDTGPTACAHDKQNRLPTGRSAEQDGHCMGAVILLDRIRIGW
jgi:hypothetical protein